MTAVLEPDQTAALWNEHVHVYAEVFEPFSMALAEPAMTWVGRVKGRRILDVGAGPGGAALRLACDGAAMTVVDASEQMVRHCEARFASERLPLATHVMDAHSLAFTDAAFDAALSIFGVILVPEPVRALSEMRRVVIPGGPVAIVTWTEPHRYELVGEIRAAIAEACPRRPTPPPPAQLRFKDKDEFRSLFVAAGLANPEIVTNEAVLTAESTAWLMTRLGFAPGMSAMLSSLGEHRGAVMQVLQERLRLRFAAGPVRLSGIAMIGLARVS
jgi:SAM-dependent methyltransferase